MEKVKLLFIKILSSKELLKLLKDIVGVYRLKNILGILNEVFENKEFILEVLKLVIQIMKNLF